ncbi:MAG TPA: DUF4157 domain-containing protein [Longimicrobiales bacterium]
MMNALLRVVCPTTVLSPEPLPEGVVLRAARWLPALAGRLSGMGQAAAAVTLGRTIVVHPSMRVTARLVKHELAHVRQWQENRWAFPVRYVVNHLRYGYERNPFEVEARAAETK